MSPYQREARRLRQTAAQLRSLELRARRLEDEATSMTTAAEELRLEAIYLYPGHGSALERAQRADSEATRLEEAAVGNTRLSFPTDPLDFLPDGAATHEPGD